MAVGHLSLKRVPLDRRTLAGMVDRLRTATDPGDIKNLADIPEFDVSLAHGLHNMILAPVEKRWKYAKSLLTVSPDSLGQLPLSLLVTEKVASVIDKGQLFSGYRNIPWLFGTTAYMAVFRNSNRGRYPQ